MAKLIFWISLSFVVYTYLLYPLIIVCAGRLRRKRPATHDIIGTLPSVTMIIVVFNEEKNIVAKLENCRKLDYPEDLMTICIVSDGSTDKTTDILSDHQEIIFIQDDVNHGKPYQINKAAEYCQSEIIVFSDVRQMYKQDALRKLVRNFSDPSVGAVSGELIFHPSPEHTGRNIGLYWKYEKMLRRAESDVDSTLGVTGAIYAIRRELFSPIQEDTILDDIEIPLEAFRKGYRVILEPEAIAYDTASADIASEFQRKVRTLTGNFQLFKRNPWLLCPTANRIFFQAVSHKLMRLFVPYALAALFITTYLVGEAATALLFWLQLIFYLAGISALLFKQMRKNRLINFISVFISLNAASVIAFYRYLFNKADARWRT